MRESIGFVISNLSGGGAQRVVANLSLELSSKYMVNLILLDGDKIGYPYKGQVVSLKTPPAQTKALKFINTLKRICRLRKNKAKLRMKTVISFMENANFINLLSGRVGKRIISVRIYKKRQPTSLYGKVNRFLMRLLYNKSDQVVVPSYGIKKDLIINFGVDEKKITVINNPCNIDYIRGKSASCNCNAMEPFKKMTVITMGRLASQKGHWHLIRAFKKIADHMPEMELAILGEGPLEEYLKKLASNLNLEDRVRFLGFQSNPYPYLASSTVFVLPSLYEGFPNVLIEAMACGIPVLAADCYTGPREILAPETDYLMQTDNIDYAEYGVLTPVCDGKKYSAANDLTREENILAQAVLALCKDPAKLDLYSKKAIERVSGFHPTNIGKQWIELIEKVSNTS